MALLYTKTQVEIREISLRDRPKELYQASEKGTVPVLITLDSVVIDESLDIMVWALKNSLKQTWLIDNCDDDVDAINQNDTLFKKWLDRYKYHDRYLENSKEYYRMQCSNVLSDYEKKLNKTKYLLRNTIGIADIAIFPFVRQFANVDYQWFENNYSSLKCWLEEITSSQLFLKVMEKKNTWIAKD
jgi:glutathione S-transferase